MLAELSFVAAMGFGESSSEETSAEAHSCLVTLLLAVTMLLQSDAFAPFVTL